MFGLFHKKTKREIKTKMTIAPNGTTYVTPDVLMSLNIAGAEEFLGRKLDIHVVDKIEKDNLP